jgi:hypothetical protein
MNSEEFREFGKAAIDFIADYHDTVRQRQVLPSVQPGYLASLVPGEMPEEGEDWRHIMRDMNTVIMPGVSARILVKSGARGNALGGRRLKSHQMFRLFFGSSTSSSMPIVDRLCVDTPLR